MTNATPKSLGYYFPAEFAPHDAIWLSWPHKEESWPGKIASIYPSYTEFVKIVSLTEKVCINVVDEKMRNSAQKMLQLAGVNLERIQFYMHPTNDAWCRDHGPAFLIRDNSIDPKVIVDWNINAWGGKYPPYDLDDVILVKWRRKYVKYGVIIGLFLGFCAGFCAAIVWQIMRLA